MRRNLQFIRAFLRNPSATGSLVPSSRFLIDRVLRNIDWDRARVIIELGPGLGCFTEQILSRMHPDAVLIAIDCNPEFTAILRRSFSDPRLHVVLSSATQMRDGLECAGLRSADCIVSGLPFANMPPAIRHEILQASLDVLRPDGSLVLFQYRKLLFPLLQTTFSSVDSDYEIRNFPPAHVFRCTVDSLHAADERQETSDRTVTAGALS